MAAEETGETGTTHIRTCPLCEAMCGLEVHVDAQQQVRLIRPDRDDVWSKGYICPKGTTLGHLHHDPDRIREPMVRDGDQWRVVSWEEAFRRCDELIHGVLERHGKAAATAYIGNPTIHNISLSRYVGLFVGLAGLPMLYSAGTVDQWPKNVSCMLMYGSMWRIPAPDIRRTDYWLVMGGNPQASQGSLLACPDVLGEIDAIRARGGKTVVVDPRRTGTADRADEWVPILPGTDALFLLALLHVVFAEGHDTLGDLEDFVVGVDVVRDLAREFSPERVSATCRIPAETIRRIAGEIVAAPSAAIYGRIGLCNQEFGTLASWLVDVLAIVTGNFDRAGGLMFGQSPAWSVSDVPDPQWADGVTFGRWRSRVRGTPEVLGQVPVSCLAEEILEPDPNPPEPSVFTAPGAATQIRLLVTIAGNPVISAPEAAAMDRAFAELECMISLDNYLNETTRHAHVLLPGLSSLEVPHFDDLILSWAARTHGNFSPPVFEVDPQRPREWQILTVLGALLAGMHYDEIDVAMFDDGFFDAMCATQGLDGATVRSHYAEGGPERLLDLQIRSGPFGDRYGERADGLTLEKFRESPHGLDFGPMRPRAREVVQTPSGKIELAPEYVVADVERLRARVDRHADDLLLISRRHVRSNNSWMHNVKVLVKGKDRCTLLMHPDDARANQVEQSALVRVTSEAGSIEVPLEISDEMMPGVVSLPHGWGHDKDGVRLSVAREHAGVNNNLLAPGHLVDVISNNAIVNGIPVVVAPA